MSKEVAIIISPNYKDYAKKYLVDCISSIRKQDYQGKLKVFITDNETSPESYQLLSRLVPEAELILNKTNDGFAKGNNDAIRLALNQNFDYIFLINMDTVVEPNCVSELVKAAESDAGIGAVQARLMLHPEKNKINSLGNTSHFLGFGYSLGYREEITNYLSSEASAKGGKLQITNLQAFHYPSGAAVLFTRDVLEKVGLYDEKCWMYNEDQEHGWRIWLSGYKCVLAPRAVVYHKYEFAKSIKQYYWMDRNRIISILICYRWLTLALILPAFILMEIGHIFFSVKNGWFNDKLRVWAYFLKPRTWAYLRRARKRNQDLRVIKDKDIIRLISGRIWYQEVDDWKLRLINPVFNLYWKICQLIIFW